MRQFNYVLTEEVMKKLQKQVSIYICFRFDIFLRYFEYESSNETNMEKGYLKPN